MCFGTCAQILVHVELIIVVMVAGEYLQCNMVVRPD